MAKYGHGRQRAAGLFPDRKGAVLKDDTHLWVIDTLHIDRGRDPGCAVIIALAAAYSVSEYLRHKGRNFPALTAITKMAMRDSAGEEKQSTFVKAPLYFAAGILASLLIFPAPFNYAAIAVVTLGDGFSSIVGRLYGRNRIPKTGGKTLEGTAAGFIFAFAGTAIFVSPATALIAAAVGMAVELLPLRVTDNLMVPLLSGLSISITGNL